jgi:NAD(P)-dependent dehydrogenase (short-subunit alcohol dehydrogenase family)
MTPTTLAGKTAIVTGAGSGIGRAIASAFATAGASVACLDIDAEAAAATCRAIGQAGMKHDSGGEALALTCDVSLPADVEAAVAGTLERFGGVQVLVNAAAAYDRAGTILDLDAEEWSRVFAVNVGGAFLMSRSALPPMIEAGGGSIIHIASQLGRVAQKERAVYCATKGAVIQLAKAMAIDHADDNIRVNALSPGPVATERLERRFGDMAAAEAALGGRQLVGRLGRPDEIAQAALFLASDAASFITGSDFLVDGGYSTV